MEKQLFMMEMPYRLSSWHKWAQTLYEHASQYNNYLFDRDGIEAFCRELDEKAKGLRNAKEIIRPAFEIDLTVFDRNYVGVGVSGEYTIRFILIRGRYAMEANEDGREYYGG